ncbi:latexin isoform X2 [Cynoglossus semilaevis]|nr:latexin isoform X2 [Cynoglossus semilaevis]
METGVLNPDHYPARRAARVVQHYLNTRYGSPYKVFHLDTVHSATAENVTDSGRKYQVEFSVKDMISKKSVKSSAEVFFPKLDEATEKQLQELWYQQQRLQQQHTPVVTISCQEPLAIDTKAQEEAWYQQNKVNQSLVSQNLPDSHGHIEPGMEPLWHLGIVASSFIMLNQSTENTLYNMAQVANVTQLETENEQLKFEYDILLHDMVSQEIPRWRMQFTWSPTEGVRVLQMQHLPKCHNCKLPETN